LTGLSNPEISRRAESPTVLVVSPCREELALLAATFRENNWTVREACTYREALTILCHDRMPVVICRRSLPDGNWKDLLGQIAVLPDAPRLIVISPEPDHHLWTEVLSMGGYDVWVAPFDADEAIRAASRAWQSWQNESSRAYQHWRPAKVLAKGAA